MSITVNINRQSPLVAYIDIDVADIKASGSYNAIFLPAGARVIGGFLDVKVAANDSGTYTLSVGDLLGTPDVDKYLTATNGKSAALTALSAPLGAAAAGVIPSGGTWVTVTSAAQNGDSSAGSIRLQVEYVIDDRVTEYEPYRG